MTRQRDWEGERVVEAFSRDRSFEMLQKESGPASESGVEPSERSKAGSPACRRAIMQAAPLAFLLPSPLHSTTQPSDSIYHLLSFLFYPHFILSSFAPLLFSVGL